MDKEIAFSNLNILQKSNKLNLDVTRNGKIIDISKKDFLGRLWKFCRNSQGSVDTKVDQVIGESILKIQNEFLAKKDDSRLENLKPTINFIKSIRPNLVVPSFETDTKVLNFLEAENLLLEAKNKCFHDSHEFIDFIILRINKQDLAEIPQIIKNLNLLHSSLNGKKIETINLLGFQEKINNLLKSKDFNPKVIEFKNFGNFVQIVKISKEKIPSMDEPQRSFVFAMNQCFQFNEWGVLSEESKKDSQKSTAEIKQVTKNLEMLAPHLKERIDVFHFSHYLYPDEKQKLEEVLRRKDFKPEMLGEAGSTYLEYLN